MVVAGAFPLLPSFLAYDSGLPSAPKERLMPDGETDLGMDTWSTPSLAPC